MELQNSFILREYLRPQVLPTTWCPGCGLGIIMSAIAQAVHFRGLDKDKVAMVSGIGCTGRMSGYGGLWPTSTIRSVSTSFTAASKPCRKS